MTRDEEDPEVRHFAARAAADSLRTLLREAKPPGAEPALAGWLSFQFTEPDGTIDEYLFCAHERGATVILAWHGDHMVMVPYFGERERRRDRLTR